MRCDNSTDGIILIDKPEGMTSHDVVEFIRKRFRFHKVGHAGTLDPMATGLLIILVGKFTKKFALFSGYDKEYNAVMRLGVSTDTGDKEGNVLEDRGIAQYIKEAEDIERVLPYFRGEIKQLPPMYSAKKVNGRKLYELARKGLFLAREPNT
ncbi:MAG: tRNA pseudouridine(55) synthase TruB, partial [Candidatus Omnitrophica bacterium]|nr:tRNA pseudouridine(55) synthase TruB [Candidatus Omnitrophota bacterium]